MPQQGTIYRVLVASPSDCDQERTIVPSVVHYWNSINSVATAAILEPVLWETHANPEFGDRPQALINAQLVESCDLLIGTFWTRLGSPTGEAESGTVEEIEKFLRAGKLVLLYFSLVPVVPGSYDADQFEALQKYRASLRQRGLIFEYDTLGSLREQVLRHLSREMAKIHKVDHVPSPGLSPKDLAADQVRQLKSSFGAFLRRLEAEWASERDSSPFSTNEGRAIMDSALRQALTFRSQITEDPKGELAAPLDSAIRQFRELQRHILVMDGGVSFQTFWHKGDQAIQSLREANEVFSKK